ncbi:MAG: hypothetical protein LBJ17_01495 [Dysgonamonadaceae bacterium]|jgi:hypothetical protein|nr:hypothetical protein [Dysgonamonadaceae bacterium]
MKIYVFFIFLLFGVNNSIVAFAHNDVIKVPDSLLYIKIIDGNEIALSELIDNNHDNVLIFRFYDFSCRDCIEKAIVQISEEFDISTYSVVFLVSYMRKRDLNILKHQFQIKFPIYNVVLRDPFMPMAS